MTTAVALMVLIGVVVQVNVRVPDPCAVHLISKSTQSEILDGAGEIMTVFDDVTPVALTVAVRFDQLDTGIVTDIELTPTSDGKSVIFDDRALPLIVLVVGTLVVSVGCL